jgi:hypothetical protein
MMPYRLSAVFPGVALALFCLFLPAARADDMDDRFALMDKNRDGLLDWEEFSAINTGILRRGFDAVDRGGDGTISREEWRVFSDSHGMDVPLPGGTSTLPARDPVPPRTEAPAVPTVVMPLVMPPSAPPRVSAPSPGVPSAPVSPGLPPVPPPEPSAPAPAAPRSPSLPLVTPPAAGEAHDVKPAPPGGTEKSQP